jgi:hypothetical protein
MLFVGKDVGDVLGYADATNPMKLIVVGWRNATPSSTASAALKKSAFLASSMS